MKYKKIAWLGLMMALIMVLIGAGCERRAPVENVVEDIPVDNTLDNSIDNTINEPILPPFSGLPDPIATLPDLKKEFEDATNIIKAWVINGQPRQDLLLTIVSSKFLNTLSDDGLDTNWFIYTTASDPDNYYLVNMPRKGRPAKRIMMPKADFNFDFEVLPIPLDQWKVSYIAALLKAENLGGAEFRGRHKTFETSVILAYPAAGLQQLNWSVTYKATDITGEQFRVQVNADTGEGIIVT